MKKILKIVGIVIFGIIILIVLVVGFLLIKNYIDSQKPWLEKDYYTGVAHTSFSPVRTEIFPSLAATKPLTYMR